MYFAHRERESRPSLRVHPRTLSSLRRLRSPSAFCKKFVTEATFTFGLLQLADQYTSERPGTLSQMSRTICRLVAHRYEKPFRFILLDILKPRLLSAPSSSASSCSTSSDTRSFSQKCSVEHWLVPRSSRNRPCWYSTRRISSQMSFVLVRYFPKYTY